MKAKVLIYDLTTLVVFGDTIDNLFLNIKLLLSVTGLTMNEIISITITKK